jgi:hypothetical protein
MIQPLAHSDGSCLNPNVRKSRQVFAEAEDLALAVIVKRIGDVDWAAVARLMPGRSARQCRDRWKGYLSPGLINDQWTGDEDELLRREWAMLGPRWSLIASKIPGRSEVSVRNRLQLLERRRARDFRSEAKPEHRDPVELSVLPQIPVPDNLRSLMGTQPELDALFDSLGRISSVNFSN